MRPDKHNLPDGNGDYHRRRTPRFELFFWEQVGSRYYLRFTRLALLLLVGIIVIPALLLVALFSWDQRHPAPAVNIDFGKPTPLPTMPTPITLPSPLPPPRVVRQPRADVPVRPSPPESNQNADELLTPSPTPRPAPTRPPT
jgi:hypothetical protein